MTGTYAQARSKCREEKQKYGNVLPIDVPIPRDEAEMTSLALTGVDTAWIGIRWV